jgi:hypothetical protein
MLGVRVGVSRGEKMEEHRTSGPTSEEWPSVGKIRTVI